MNEPLATNGHPGSDNFAFPQPSPDASRLLQIGRLRGFDGVDDAKLEQLARDAEWFCVPAGWTLFRKGDTPDGLYLVTSGKLAAMCRDESGQEASLSYIAAGSVLGETALLSGTGQPADVIALRDSELLRFPAVDLKSLFDRHPLCANFFGKLLLQRLAPSGGNHAKVEAPHAVALVPLSKGIPITELAHRLSEALSAIGLRTQVLDAFRGWADVHRRGNLDESNDVVIYQAGADASAWTRLCLRQSDLVLAIADASGPPPAFDAPSKELLLRDRTKSLELLVLHRASKSAAPWLEDLIEGIGASFHTHVRRWNRADIDRLARLLTRRAVGVVLSGGGARGFAHLGVIAALREAGLPIDLVAGTSMGALIAAGVALEREALREEMYETFVRRNPLTDYTLPIISLYRGRLTSRLLQERAQGLRVSDCWIPFFCTSSNLSSGSLRVHRDGPLWKAVRASIAVPGILPPVIDRGEVLIDGGILNHLPADVMIAMRRGPVIAVDAWRKSS